MKENCFGHYPPPGKVEPPAILPPPPPSLKERKKMKLLETCVWTEKEEGAYWETGCGRTFPFLNDGPAESGFLYCPFCKSTLIPHYLPKKTQLDLDDNSDEFGLDYLV